MAGLRGIMNRFLGGRGATTRGTGVGTTTGGTTGTTGAAGGRRTQDEAIGRGVRGLLSRFRR